MKITKRVDGYSHYACLSIFTIIFIIISLMAYNFYTRFYKKA
ncbi:hypothetical protein BSPLISOX_2172 [uncultured Gammaproteobacteria bacterium]|nr:hypothetical protein [uncultured Gammaproteobacteria bacterium]CAC9469013.1 hypothetical protein [uncultured Gammaproteobacteria bacterium]VVH65557.1 hypothetical protein BSPLISOX_2172 [uncultured Gammaproteobacteria bacterium]